MKIQSLMDNLPKKARPVARFINIQESDANLSTVRLGQEIATNWVPKALFARSVVDFTEVTFLEFTENALVYLAPVLLGEIFKKGFSKKLPENMKAGVLTSAQELLKNEPLGKALNNKKLMPVKAAIALGAFAVPLAEYTISYVKNLFTLKLFKQADFNNIANLNKDKKEDTEKQVQVKMSTKKHIKLAAGLYAGCLALAATLVTRGKNSKALQNFSELILAPGSRLFKNNEKNAKFIDKYFGLDFMSKNGKLAMSNGQLTACVLLGGFGYFGAAKDRGKENFKEVLYRFPLVGFYAITGSALFDKGFKSILKKQNKCKELFEAEKQNGKMPKMSELDKLAKKLATQNRTAVQEEFNKLFKQKSKMVMTPFLFSVGFMGLFVAGVSRYFTQYRYNKEHKNK